MQHYGVRVKTGCLRVGRMCPSGTVVSLSRIGGVIVSVLTSSAVDHGFQPRSGQTKDYKIGIFSAKNAALRRKNTNWLA